jgi:hypothetical protein
MIMLPATRRTTARTSDATASANRASGGAMPKGLRGDGVNGKGPCFFRRDFLDGRGVVAGRDANAALGTETALLRQARAAVGAVSGRGHEFVRVWWFSNQAGLGRREAAYP